MDEDYKGFVKRDRTARLIAVANLLYQHPRGLTAHEIAGRVGVNVRTVYRDLRALELEVKVALWQDGPKYFADSTSFLPPLKLNLQEAVTLLLSVRLMARFQDYRDPHAISAFSKLAMILPIPVAEHAHISIASMMQLPVDETRNHIFDVLSGAWAEGRKVRIWYPHVNHNGRTFVNERLVSPYFLEPNPTGHTRYLIAHDAYTDKIRTFRVERIEKVELTQERFEMGQDFTLDARLRHAWGVSDEDLVQVKLRFQDAAAATRVQESRWHPSQRHEQQADGSVEVTYEVNGLREITPWVLSWGARVEVLSPAELRQLVGAAARAQAEMYRDTIR